MIEKRSFAIGFTEFFSNVWAIFNYSITQWLPSARIANELNLNSKEKVIVSLTTKPSRIHRTWLVIESILRQEEKPNAIILYLSKEEFLNEPPLPAKLLGLQKRGLQIKYVTTNLKPHNKYFHVMEAYPKATVITIDDDKIYPANLVGKLKASQKRYPNAISAVMTRCIKINGNKIVPYMGWDIYSQNSAPSHALLSLGVCGVLFPPGSLHNDVFDKDVLKEKALLTDDMWIKIMALRHNTKVVSLAGEYKAAFTSLRGLQSEQLRNYNIALGKNDTVFEDLHTFYNVDLSLILENSLCQEQGD